MKVKHLLFLVLIVFLFIPMVIIHNINLSKTIETYEENQIELLTEKSRIVKLGLENLENNNAVFDMQFSMLANTTELSIYTVTEAKLNSYSYLKPTIPSQNASNPDVNKMLLEKDQLLSSYFMDGNIKPSKLNPEIIKVIKSEQSYIQLYANHKASSFAVLIDTYKPALQEDMAYYIVITDNSTLLEAIHNEKIRGWILQFAGISASGIIIFILLLSMDKPFTKVIEQLEHMVDINIVQPIEIKTKVKDFKIIVDIINRLINEVQEKESENKALLDKAMIDGLTGLRNHKSFYQSLQDHLNNPSIQSIAVVVIDIDDFKVINDKYGHIVGDMVLVEISNILRASSSDTLHCYRYGGEEFTIVFINQVIEAVQFTLQNISHSIAGIHKSLSDIHNTMVTVSCGISRYPFDSLTKESLFESADMAMYYSKMTGKNKITLYDKVVKEMYREGTAYNTSSKDATKVYQLLMQTLTERSSYAGEQAYKVMETSLKFADVIGLNPESHEKLKTAALLHDIGLISLPDVVLRKIDHLESLELDLMKKHVQFSLSILQNIESDQEVLKAVYHHHENWDGSGYPLGLSGSEIPRLARIIRIVDAYEAIYSRFKDRTQRNMNLILGELRSGSGSEFDPNLLELFIKAVPSMFDLVSHHLHDFSVNQLILDEFNRPSESKPTQTVTQVNVMMVSPDFKVLHINESLESLLGVSSNKCKGKPCYNILMGLPHSCSNCRMLEAIESQEVKSHVSKKTLRDGSVQVMNQTWIPILNKGDFSGVMELISVISL